MTLSTHILTCSIILLLSRTKTTLDQRKGLKTPHIILEDSTSTTHTMESHYLTPSPMVKHEELMGDELMPSLFGSEASPGMESIDNWNTPDRDMMSPIPESTPEAGEKKPKKRKSWGQVLPEPKTQLPPRFVPPCCCPLLSQGLVMLTSSQKAGEDRRREGAAQSRASPS